MTNNWNRKETNASPSENKPRRGANLPEPPPQKRASLISFIGQKVQKLLTSAQMRNKIKKQPTPHEQSRRETLLLEASLAATTLKSTKTVTFELLHPKTNSRALS